MPRWVFVNEDGDFINYHNFLPRLWNKATSNAKIRKPDANLGDGVQSESLEKMEAATGFEPVSNGFADRRLTTWLCRHVSGREPIRYTGESREKSRLSMVGNP